MRQRLLCDTWVLAGAMAAAWCAACATAPAPRYYTLDMTPSGRAAAGVNIDVGDLSVAEPIERPAILVRTKPTEVEYYASDRWAAGVGRMVREKLEAEFGPGDASRGTVVLTGEMQAFEQVDTGGGADVRLRFRADFHRKGYKRGDEPLASRVYDLRRPLAAAGPGAAAEGLSRLMEDLAAEVSVEAAGLGTQ